MPAAPVSEPSTLSIGCGPRFARRLIDGRRSVSSAVTGQRVGAVDLDVRRHPAIASERPGHPRQRSTSDEGGLFSAEMVRDARLPGRR